MPRRKTSAPVDADESFPFIVSNGPGTVKDPALRTLIRKQAMKEIGFTRRRPANREKIKVTKTSVNETIDCFGTLVDQPLDSTPSSSEGLEMDTPSSLNEIGVVSPLHVEKQESQVFESQANPGFWEPFYMMPMTIDYLSGYERVRAEFCVDLTALSMLTNFNVGRSAVPVLSADNGVRLIRLMESKQWSYLEFIPRLYDSSRCLAAAVDCVLAKVSAVLLPLPGSQESACKLYAKALRSLQNEIVSPQACDRSDVLGAIQLLGLHELLDSTRVDAYTHHLRGSVDLVKHRGITNFDSEFEKALFAGHVGPVVSDALMSNTHCYLAEARWTELYTSLIEETSRLTERSALTIHARSLMFRLPGLWHDVHQAALVQDLSDEVVLMNIETRCRELHAALLDWMDEYKTHCCETSFTSPTMAEIGLRRELFGAALECLLLVKRMLATVCESVRVEVEVEVQAMAKLMIEIQNQPAPCHSWLFSAHEVEIAQVAIDDREEWEKDLRGLSVQEQRCIAKNRYHLWTMSLRGPV